MRRIVFPKITSAFVNGRLRSVEDIAQLPEDLRKTAVPMTVSRLLREALETPPEGAQGLRFTDIEARLPIATRLREANGRIELENSEHAILESAVRQTLWTAGLNEDIHAVIRSVIDAESFTPDENRATRRAAEGK